MIKAVDINKSYGDLHVLQDISLEINQGEVVSIVGPSGAGKTTLLQILGTLDHPDSGTLLYGDIEVSKLKEKELARFRNEHIGFVFQAHHLLPEFTALENVCIPALIRGVPMKEASERALELLTFMKVDHRATHKPQALPTNRVATLTASMPANSTNSFSASASSTTRLLSSSPTTKNWPPWPTEKSQSLMEKTQSKQQIIYGLRPVIEAIGSGQQVERVLIQNGLNSSLLNELRTKLKEHDIPFQYVPVEKLNKMTTGNHQGVVATIAAVKYHSFMQLMETLEEPSVIILLDHVTDVRNMGAIARTAECTGVAALVVPDHGSAALNEDAIKTSSGALLRLPVCREQNLKTVVTPHYGQRRDRYQYRVVENERCASQTPHRRRGGLVERQRRRRRFYV